MDINLIDTQDSNTSDCNINDHELETIIENLESGTEPLLLKIVSGTASEEEINQWAKDNDIPHDDINEVLSMLSSSYIAGAQIAEKIEQDLIEQDMNKGKFDKQEILSKLDSLLSQLDGIKYEIETLMKNL